MLDRNDLFVQPSVGFSLVSGIGTEAAHRGLAARENALRHFPWLTRSEIRHGTATLTLWGHNRQDLSVKSLDDGSLVFLVGSPQRKLTWDEVLPAGSIPLEKFRVPWNGRFIFGYLNASGSEWRIWSDWCGAVPVFASEWAGGGIVGSLEPEVVATSGLSVNEVTRKGLVQLLTLGHFVGEDTLYEGVKALPADSVTRFRDGACERSETLWTVEPSTDRFDHQEAQLVVEMHGLVNQMITEALDQSPNWILPLSAGVDSRIIAAVAAQGGHQIKAITYGPESWIEVKSARDVARMLGIDWQRVSIPPEYLERHTGTWLDWFGTSMHAHGMYQMPFLSMVREFSAPIINGFMGDPLAGNHIATAMELGYTQRERVFNYEPQWSFDELDQILDFEVSEYVAEISSELEEQLIVLPGEPFQRQMFMDFWNRQRRLISYQPLMYDYFSGISTPFLSVDYARFCMSLSDKALTGRSLQLQMVRRYYPGLFKIRGTFSERSFGRKLVNRSQKAVSLLAQRVPVLSSLISGHLISEYANTIQEDAVHTAPGAARISSDHIEILSQLGFSRSGIDTLISDSLNGDNSAYDHLRCIQPLTMIRADDAV